MEAIDKVFFSALPCDFFGRSVVGGWDGREEVQRAATEAPFSCAASFHFQPAWQRAALGSLATRQDCASPAAKRRRRRAGIATGGRVVGRVQCCYEQIAPAGGPPLSACCGTRPQQPAGSCVRFFATRKIPCWNRVDDWLVFCADVGRAGTQPSQPPCCSRRQCPKVLQAKPFGAVLLLR